MLVKNRLLFCCLAGPCSKQMTPHCSSPTHPPPHPLCFRSCGPSLHLAQGPTPRLRPVLLSGSAAGSVQRAQLLVCGRRVEAPEPGLGSTEKVCRLHSESGCRLRTPGRRALRYRLLFVRLQVRARARQSCTTAVLQSLLHVCSSLCTWRHNCGGVSVLSQSAPSSGL